jgi:WD40 repeat protein
MSRELKDTDVATQLLIFSPDERTLVSAGRQGKMRLWDVATGRPLWTATSLGESPSALTFSADGKMIASAAAEEKMIRLWESATGRQLRALAGKSGSACLAFSPTSKILASGDANDNTAPDRCSVRLWDVSAGTEIRRMTGNLFGVDLVAFTTDGSKLVSGGLVTALRVYDMATGKALFQPEAHESLVTSVAFSPDSKTVATGGFDGALRLWEAATGQSLHSLSEGYQRAVWSVAFSLDGRSLASTTIGDGWVRIWDPGTGRVIRRLQNKEKGPLSIAYDPDGRTLVTAGGGVERADRALRFWDSATLTELIRPDKIIGLIGSHCYSEDGRLLVTMIQQLPMRQASVSVWDLPGGHEIRKWPMPPLTIAPAIAPDGTLVAVAESFSKRLHLLNIGGGKESLFTLSSDGRPSSLTFSPDGRILAIGADDGTIVLWEVAAGQPRRMLHGHLSSVSSISFSANGRLMASASHDSTALIWDMMGRAGMGTSPAKVLSQEELQTHWKTLAGEDAHSAYQAMLTLQLSPAQTVPFLRRNLQPQAAADRQHITRLIAELDSSRFAARQKAMRELEGLGDRAESELARTLHGQASLEVRQRIEQLLSKLQTPVAAPGLLRSLRAVEVLEQIGLPEAAQILQTLAAGGTDNRLTKVAATALSRLAKRLEKPHAKAERGAG